MIGPELSSGKRVIYSGFTEDPDFCDQIARFTKAMESPFDPIMFEGERWLVTDVTYGEPTQRGQLCAVYAVPVEGAT